MMRFEFAVAADLAANILSVCLVVFLTLLPLAAEGDATSASGARPAALREAGDRFLVAERRPLSGAGMVQLLHARRSDPDLVVADLFADRVELRRGAGASEVVDPARIGELGSRRVALFVLDPAFYARVRSRLASDVVEMSVPDALRDPEAPRTRFHPAFLRLDAAARPLPDFEAALMRILQAGAGTAQPGSSGSSSDAAVLSLRTRLLAGLQVALQLGVPCIAGLALLNSERLRRRRRFRA